MANEQVFRPTLLVGLGGTGCRIAESVYQRAVASGAGLQGRIQVVGFDTDENDMRRRSGLGERQRVRFSSNFTVEELLDRFPELERDWFVTPRAAIPMEIRRMTLVDGAAQLRMLTRLGLYEAQREGRIDLALGAVAAQLAQHDNREGYAGQINVLIVGSLAGATGSGSFLQFALLINEICRQRSIEAGVRGLFLMPDVYVRSGLLPSGQIPNVLANGYASFKEFHAVNMRATERAGRYDFSFEFAPGRPLKPGDMPFLSLTVIDYEDMQGGNLGRSLDAYRRLAENAAFTLLLTPIGSKADSVTVNDARQTFAVAGKGTHNRIAAIGLSAIVYPHQEIVAYLGAQLAREVLQGDWLRLDQSFRARLRRFRDQRAAGNMTVEEPEAGAAYLEDLRQLALDDNQAFFREIWEDLHPTIRDEKQGDVTQPLYERYLDAIEAQLLKAFWNTEDLGEIHQRKSADPDQFASDAALAENVRRLEYRLDGDLRQIDVALVNRPTDILINLLTTADDAGEADWRDHHLQTFLVRSGPHLVRNRAFLYALRRLVAERLAALRPDETRKRLYRLATTFDPERGPEPTVRGTPKIMATAGDIARRGALARVLKGGSKQFVDQYVAYYNGSLRTLRAFAEERARQRLYEGLIEEIDEQQRVLTGMFLEVEGALERLNQTIRDDERRHQPGAVSENIVFVCADERMKQALWEELRDASGGQRLGPEANKALARQVYQKARRNRRARKPESLEDLRDLFWHTVVEDFAVKRVAEDYRTVHAMSVMGAIEKEAEISGRPAGDRLRELVRIVERQSEPMVTLTSPTDGQAVRFWALNPTLRAEMQAFGDVDLLLNPAGEGTQPVEEPEFTTTELSCVSLQVNLELAHLAKLRPAVVGSGSVAPDRAGRYFNAYQEMVDELVDAAGSNRVATTFTPHIHRDWHKPGILPEIAEGVTRALVRDVNRAIVAALATGVLRLEQLHGERIAEISTVGRVPTGGVSLELVRSHDVFEIVRAFERHPEAVRACLNLWQHEVLRLSRSAESTGSQLLKSFETGVILDRVLRIAESRHDEALRDDRVINLVAGNAHLVTEAVAAARPDLPERARMGEANRLAMAAGEQALARLRESQTPETFRKMELLVGKGLEHWRVDSGASLL
jgi:hypothetical protein